MAAVTGLRIVKQFDYRGDPTEQWSNMYHFRNAPPGDDASWLQLANDLVALEKHCYPSSSAVVSAYGYNDDSDTAHSVWSHDWGATTGSIPGDLPAQEEHCAGDQAAMVYWKTAAKNSRGKWIYLRKYMHDGFMATAVRDALAGGYETALRTFAGELDPNGGAFWGGIRGQKRTDNITAHGVSSWITTRTLKRRGKRPLARA